MQDDTMDTVKTEPQRGRLGSRLGFILLPLGSLVFVLFCVTKKGWGWDNFVAEANAGKGAKVQKWMRGYMTYVLPIIIFAIFLVGMLQKFGVF